MAQEHCLPLKKLIIGEIASVILKDRYQPEMLSKSVSSIFGNSNAKPAINGIREMTRSLVDALEQLTLRQFKITLEAQHQSAAPTMQDLVTVALERFIEDWNTSDSKEELLNELLEHRQKARSRMGKKKTKSAEN